MVKTLIWMSILPQIASVCSYECAVSEGVDMFPRTGTELDINQKVSCHVETVVLMSKVNPCDNDRGLKKQLSKYAVVDFLNQHNTDLLACLWIDLYTVISLQKEKGSRAPTRKVVYSETMVKTMVSEYTLILKEDSGVFC